MRRMSMRRYKAAEKKIAEERATFLHSITTPEDFQHHLGAAVEAVRMHQDPTTHNTSGYLKARQVLMRGHQILEPETFWSIVQDAGIAHDDALDMVQAEIAGAALHAMNAPFFSYMEEILKRMVKMSREAKADALPGEIIFLKYTALYREFCALATAWDSHRPADAQKDLPSTYDIFGHLFAPIRALLEQDPE